MPRKLLLIAVLLFAGCTKGPVPLPDAQKATIDKYLTQYVPYDMPFDASGYSATDKAILKKLIQAAEYIDTIYWLQTSKYGMALRDSLRMVMNNPALHAPGTQSWAPPLPHAEKLLILVARNAGPFELLNDHTPFFGSQQYYAGDEIYPRGMTAEQFDAYVATLPKADQAMFMSPYTTIRSNGNGGYKAVPYHEEYRQYITPIVALLNECADLSDNPSFASFMRKKAQALATDVYFDADVAWIDMKDNKFDCVLGPFETYSDGIKGVKAKYEANIEVVDQAESKNLDLYTKYLARFEDNLPVSAQYKSVVKGLTAKFTVVRDIKRSGEAAAGYQAVATNLPNDPEVHEKKGTIKTFWKNMFEARFNAIIKPVSMRLIDESQLSDLSADGFFQGVLMHEICHAIGPRTVKVGPKKGMAVNAAIGPNYNALEECKADIVGLLSLDYLIRNGVVDKSKEKSFYVSYLGSSFRSVRFGLGEAHAKAAAIAIAYLRDKGALRYDPATHRWSADFPSFAAGIRSLSAELLILEGDGDNQKVQQFYDKWAKVTPELQESLDLVKDLPVDVLPHYSITWE